MNFGRLKAAHRRASHNVEARLGNRKISLVYQNKQNRKAIPKGLCYDRKLLEAGQWDEFYKIFTPRNNIAKGSNQISRSPSEEERVPQTNIAMLPKQLRAHVFLNNEN